MARVAPPDHRAAPVSQAIEALRQSIAQGYRSSTEVLHDADLSAIRGCPEFQVTLRDLAFPAEPFARGD
jgi:hypothetical protein